MLYPIIDIGSNTVKISVLDSEHIFRKPPAFFKARPIMLKSKIENGILPDPALNELCEVISEYKNIALMLTEKSPMAFATASLRKVENSAEIIDAVKEKTGIEINIISGEEEAVYSFTGAIENKQGKSGITVDMGGGSTEIMAFAGKEPKKYTSLPVGCITLTKDYFSFGNKSAFECKKYISSLLKKDAPYSAGKDIFLSGGSAKALLRYKNFITKRSDFSISYENLESIYEHFYSSDTAGKEKIRSILKERYELVPAAVCMFESICNFYGKNTMKVCKNGVREGFLIKYLEKNKK